MSVLNLVFSAFDFNVVADDVVTLFHLATAVVLYKGKRKHNYQRYKCRNSQTKEDYHKHVGLRLGCAVGQGDGSHKFTYPQGVIAEIGEGVKLAVGHGDVYYRKLLTVRGRLFQKNILTYLGGIISVREKYLPHGSKIFTEQTLERAKLFREIGNRFTALDLMRLVFGNGGEYQPLDRA